MHRRRRPDERSGRSLSPGGCRSCSCCLPDGPARVASTLAGASGRRWPCARWLLWSFGAPRGRASTDYVESTGACGVGRRAGGERQFVDHRQGTAAGRHAADDWSPAFWRSPRRGRFVVPPRGRAGRERLLFLVGLAGTLPILASVKQAGHYLVPAVPLLCACGRVSLVGPTVAAAVQSALTRRRRASPSACRDRALVAARHGGGVAVSRRWGATGSGWRTSTSSLDGRPGWRTIGLCPESNGDWGLHAWFERRFRRQSGRGGTDARRDGSWKRARGPRGAALPADCAAATEPRRQLVLMKCRRVGRDSEGPTDRIMNGSRGSRYRLLSRS